VNCPDFASLAPLWWYKLPKNRRRQLSAILPALAFVLLLVIIMSFVFSGNKSETGSGTGGGAGDDLCHWNSYVLPKDFTPMHYNVDMSVEWKEPFMVSGKVEAFFAPEQEYNNEQSAASEGDAKLTRCIVLHAGANLNIGEISFVMINRKRMSEKRRKYNEEHEQLVLEFEEPIDPSRLHHVELSYSYELVESMRGFYRSNYRDSKDVEHMLASTQMEAADARRAFPCFDQPNLKANFDFTISVKRYGQLSSDFQVLFNTPLREGGYSRSTGAGGATVDKYAFEVTPTMSTYLVAFVMGDLVQATSSVDGGRVRVSVWGTPEHADDLSDALESCVKILPAYEELLGIPFPLKKLDLVAIPSFEAGAMENWGLITYRESSLLVNPQDASDFDVLWATTTVAHELVHMWFGNLVTMDWWNDLFLNEGFAEYLQYIGVTVAKPQYNADQLFPILTLQNALSADAYAASHPIHVPYEETLSSIEIDGLFDGITYDKGASIIRMLRSYMSGGQSIDSDNLLAVDPFITGLRSYLKEYKYENADSTKFWTALGEHANIDGFNIMESMRTWISRPNYPLVRLSWAEEPGTYTMGTLKMSQMAFQKNGVQACSTYDRNSKWWVPLAYVTEGSLDSPTYGVLDQCESGDSNLIRLQSPEDFVKVNPGQAGFYRVDYPQEMWKRLGDNIASGKLSSLDTSSLLDDAYAIVQAKEMNVSTLLDLTDSASRRKFASVAGSRDSLTSDYQSWYDVSFVLNGIKSKLEGSACQQDFESLVEKRVTAAIDDYDLILHLEETNANSILGSFQHRVLIGLLFTMGEKYGNTKVEQLALDSFSNSIHVHPNLRYSVYKATAKSGASGYQQVLDKYNTAIDADEKEKLLFALGAVTSKDLITKSLGLILGSQVESMYVRSFVSRIAGSSYLGRQMSWTYLQNNFDEVYEKVNGGKDVSSSRLAGLVKSVCSGFSDEEKRAEVQAFYEKYTKWIPRKIFHQIEENIRANKDWKANNEQQVCTWTEEHKNK
jgi:aminopeptidase N